VFVQDGDHFAEREVTLGRQSATSVEILSGLKSGETYVAVGSFLVKSDMQKSEAGHEH
jgi:cobalt-zinc-cadmium efflux system membrane fusion protein